MKMRVTLLISAALAGMAFNSPLSAQEEAYYDSEPGYAEVPNYSGYAPYGPFDTRFQFRHDVGEGVGYGSGFTTFGALQPIYIEPDRSLFFFDLRGSITNEGDVLGNAAAGFRMFIPEVDKVFGASFHFDHDDSGYFNYDQFGVGLELLGPNLDLRANAYMPIERGENIAEQNFTGTSTFIGNNIGIGRFTLLEQALSGGDFEFGGAFPVLGDFGVRNYFGAYYLEGSNTDGTFGFRTRHEVMVNDDVTVQVALTNDQLFGTNVTGAVSILIPDGKPSRWFSRQPTGERLYGQVERQYRVAVHRRGVRDNVLAIDPNDGLPIVVAHVDNTAAGGGTGTNESRFNTLPGVTDPAWDIIYVRRGNGTVSGMDGGIVLNDNQRLLGEGFPHLVTSTQGTFLLPDNTPGLFPIISNLTGDAVTLADNNEVAGFRILGATGSGIAGAGSHDFNLHNLTVQSNLGGGINLNDATGDGFITDNTIGVNDGDAISINNTSTVPLDLIVDNNDLELNTGAGIDLMADDSTINVEITNNVSRLNDTGLALSTENSGEINAIVEDNEFDLNDDDGYRAVADSGVINIASARNSLTTNGDAGVDLSILNLGEINFTSEDDEFFGNVRGLALSNDSGLADLAFLRANFNTNTTSGINMFTSNGGTTVFDMVESTVSGNTGSGGVFIGGDDATLVANIADSEILQNDGAGVGYNIVNGSTLTSTITGSNISDAPGRGIDLFSDDSSFDLTIGGLLVADGNLFDSNSGASIAMEARGTSSGTFLIQNNTITRTEADLTLPGDGINVSLFEDSSLTNSLIADNVIGDADDDLLANEGRGVHINSNDNSIIDNLDVTNNIIARNGSDNLSFLRQNESIIDGVDITDNDLQFAGANGLNLDARNGANDVLNFFVARNLINNSTTHGVRLHVEADAQLEVNLFDNEINDNGGDGIELTEVIGSPGDQRDISGTFTKNQINRNAGHGIEISAGHTLTIGANGTDPADGESLGNEIIENGLDGIEINSAGTTTIVNNEITDNGTGGIDINAINQAITSNITNNRIQRNNGDAIESIASDDFGFSELNLLGNLIGENNGRGIDILTRENATTILRMGDDTLAGLNLVRSNALEGIYVVNTSSLTQVQDVSATVALAADGLTNVSPNTLLDLRLNQIQGNGTDVLNVGSGTGLVIRVGTANSQGGLIGPAAGLANPFAGPFFAGNGQVQARVLNNAFSGNFGDDVFIESFTSTLPPQDSAGTWDTTPNPTVITTLERDPLARLNLAFRGNTGDSLDVTRFGAFYNNDEEIFKSRDTAQNPPGPFLSGDRLRNAQRLLGNVGVPPLTTFGYDGLGNSTFRIEADFDVAGFTAGDTFILDTGNVPPLLNAQGVPLGFNFGELPFGWDTVAPGALGF